MLPTSPGRTCRSRRRSTSRPGAGATLSGASGGLDGANAAGLLLGAAGARRGGAGTTLDCAFRPTCSRYDSSSDNLTVKQHKSSTSNAEAACTLAWLLIHALQRINRLQMPGLLLWRAAACLGWADGRRRGRRQRRLARVQEGGPVGRRTWRQHWQHWRVSRGRPHQRRLQQRHDSLSGVAQRYV